MSPRDPVGRISRRHTLTAFVRLAAIDALFKQLAVRQRHQFAIIGQQRRLHRTDLLDMPFDLSNPHLLAHLVQLAHVDAGQDLPGNFATAKPMAKATARPTVISPITMTWFSRSVFTSSC